MKPRDTIGGRTSTGGGFTLIELLVSTAILGFVLVAAVGSLLAVVEANRTVQSQKILMDNLNSALAHMTRNLVVGSDYRCVGGSQDPNCPSDDPCRSSISFMSQRRVQTTFALSGNRIVRTTSVAPTPAPITAVKAEIDRLCFYVSGVGRGDNLQPRILVVVGGMVRRNVGAPSRFDVEMFISQRLPEI